MAGLLALSVAAAACATRDVKRDAAQDLTRFDTFSDGDIPLWWKGCPESECKIDHKKKGVCCCNDEANWPACCPPATHPLVTYGVPPGGGPVYSACNEIWPNGWTSKESNWTPPPDAAPRDAGAVDAGIDVGVRGE